MKKPTFIGGGKPGERHAVLGDDQIYCEWQGAASAPVITHSGVKCEFCKKTLAGFHYVGGVSSNPVPSYAMILRRKLAKGHSQEEAEELARRELQQANIFLSEGRKKNPAPVFHWTKYNTKIETWFERDRAHVELRNLKGTTIIEWWDDAVQEAVTDGFLNPRDWHGSAVEYANSIGAKPRRKNPVRKNGPVKIYGQTEKIFMKKTAGPYKGQKFVHDFKGGVRQIGMPRGTVVKFPDGRTARLTTRSVLLDGKKDLWRNFAA
jgi:hypothetical protein